MESLLGCKFANGGYCCPHLIEKGRGIVRSGDMEVELSAGDMFCILPDNIIEYADFSEEPWIFSWVHISGDDAHEACRKMGFSKQNFWRRNVDFRLVKSALASLRNYLNTVTPISPYTLTGLLYCFLGSVIQETPRLCKQSLVQRAEQIMHALLKDGINIGNLAREMRVDRSTLLHAFKRERGCSPFDVLQQLRIARVKQMLLTTEVKLSVIAEACGFTNEKYMIRIFRKITGFTPGNFRQQR